MKKLAVVLVSGGLDSCVTAAVARQEHELALLHVSYGQRTQARELRAFHDIADFYKVAEEHRLEVSIEHLKKIGGSALTDANIPIPHPQRESDAIPATYVPFRNAHLLAIGVSWAETIGACKVFIGAVEEDSSGYPDCREIFIKAFSEAVKYGTKPESNIEVVAPLIHMRKSEIVKLGVELGAPLHLTWSCYKREDVACGECESCVLRLRAFKEAGVPDPIPYLEK